MHRLGSSSDQSSLDRSKVAGSCGSGTCEGSQSIWANSSSRPVATVSASSGSGWAVKNCQGVVAPHSSPMKIIGVNGLSSVTKAASPSCCGSSLAGQPLTVGPVADLVVVVGADHQPPGRRPQRVDRVAVAAPAEAGLGAVVEEPVLEHLAQRRQGVEVGVVAGRVPGQADVERVVEVVAPLRGQPVAAAVAGGDQPRVVQVGLGDQRQRPAQEGADRAATSMVSSSSRCVARVSDRACTASSRRPSTW